MLTMQPKGGRGCGSRKPGGLYGATGLSPTGTPLRRYMLDPPVPYLGGGAFQGFHEAPEYITAGWDTDKNLILMDWVGETGYPTVPDYMEEGRRFGFSRRIPKTFPWESVNGRQVWLASIHAKAAPMMAVLEHYREWGYHWCYASGEDHFPECVYHTWLLAYRIHGVDAHQNLTVDAPWGAYSPLRMLDKDTLQTDWVGPRELPSLLPGETYPHPAFFIVLPLTHLEAIEYVDEDVAEKVGKTGLDLYVVSE